MLKTLIESTKRMFRTVGSLNNLRAPKKGTQIAHGRVTLHGVALRRTCPKCKKRVSIGFTGMQGLWAPLVGVPIAHRVVCPKCEAYWTIVVFLHVLLEIQKEYPQHLEWEKGWKNTHT